MNTTTDSNNVLYYVNQSNSSSLATAALENVSLSILDMINNTTSTNLTTTPPQSSIILPPLKGLPPGPPSFSQTQRKWLAYAPKVPAFLSIVGSAWIMYDLLSAGTSSTSTSAAASRRSSMPRGQRGQRQRQRPNSNHHCLDSTYARILLGMSSADLLLSIWLFIGTWAASEERVISDGLLPLLFGSDKGNQATCSAQGFFLQLGIAAPLYNVSLAIYSLLVVRYNYHESQFSWRHSRRRQPSYSLWCSWALLGLPMLWALGTAIAGLALQLYNLNPATFHCWISPYPAHCDPIFGQSRDMPKAAYVCQRGTNANKYRFAFAFVPLWLAWIIMVIAMILVVQAVYQLERRAQQWRFSSQLNLNKSSLNFTIQPNTLQNEKGAANPPLDIHDDNISIQDLPMMISDTVTANSKSDSQKRVEEAKEEEIVDPFYNSEELEVQLHVEDEDNSDEERKQQGTDTTTDANNSLTDSISKNPPQPSTRKLKRLSALQSVRSSMSGGLASFSRSVMTSSTDDNAAERRQEKDNLIKTRKVGAQALYFVLAFLVTWTCSMIYQLSLMGTFLHDDDEGGGVIDSFAFIFIAAMLFPLQGFLNALVVIRPRYIQARERHPQWSWCQTIHFILFRQYGANNPSSSAGQNNNHHNNNTHSGGSSKNYPPDSGVKNKDDSKTLWRGLSTKFSINNKNEEASVTNQ